MNKQSHPCQGNRAQRVRTFAVLSFFALLAPAAQATLHQVVVNGVKVDDYNKIVEGLIEGDEISFSGRDKPFKLYKKLGGGSMDVIYDIGNGQAIRFPKNTSSQGDFGDAHQVKYQQLQAAGVQAVEVYPELSVPNQFTIVKKENIEMTLQQFFDDPKLLNQERSKVTFLIQKLIDFAKTTAKFKSIVDCRPANIAWNGEKWILLDWGPYLIPAHNLASDLEDTIVDNWAWNYDFLPLPSMSHEKYELLRDQMRAAIYAKRRQLSAHADGETSSCETPLVPLANIHDLEVVMDHIYSKIAPQVQEPPKPIPLEIKPVISHVEKVEVPSPAEAYQRAFEKPNALIQVTQLIQSKVDYKPTLLQLLKSHTKYSEDDLLRKLAILVQGGAKFDIQVEAPGGKKIIKLTAYARSMGVSERIVKFLSTTKLNERKH